MIQSKEDISNYKSTINLSSTITTLIINDKSTVNTKKNLDFAHAQKVDFPGSCAAHKMGRKSAYFQVHAHAHLAGSGDMRMC